MVEIIVRDLTILVVWVIAIEALIQGIINFIAYRVLRRIGSVTEVGKTLAKRELSAGVTSMFRATFKTVLAVAITWPGTVPSFAFLTPLFAALSITSGAAIYYGGRFVLALKRGNWGREPESKPESKDERDTRQDTREDGLDQRALGLDKRGWDMSKESIEQNRHRRDLDKRDRGSA